MLPFVPSTFDLVRLNTKWQEQLKNEKERVRRSLIVGDQYKVDDMSDEDSMDETVVTMINPSNNNINASNNYNSILPVASVVSTINCTQKSIADEYTLNREQRAAFMIIISHLDAEKQSRKGNCMIHIYIYI